MAMIHLVRLVVLALALTVPIAAQSQTFTLDLADPNTREVTLSIQALAILPIKIIRSGDTAAVNVSLDISAFVNDQGLSKRFTISVPGGSAPEADHLEASFAGSVLPVNIHVPELPSGGKYTGRIILSPPQGDTVTWTFILTLPADLRPATLVLDQNTATLTGVRRWCLWPIDWCLVAGDEPVVIVHVRDKTGNWPLDGVMARLEPGLKAPATGFDVNKQISAKLDMLDVPDIFASPAAGQRRVDPRGQATITLAFKNLEPEEYTIPLRITAKNSGDDDLQRLTVNLQIRNHLASAILVLVLAALLSFMATKVVVMLRQRGAFLQRLQAMRPAWLVLEPATLSVIWLRATVRQAENLSKRYWMTGQSEIDARLTGAASMLEVLDRVRQVRERINAIPDAPVKRRAAWKLDTLIKRLSAARLTDQDVARFKQDLDAFDPWCDPDQAKRAAAFWTDLLSAIKAKSSEVQISAIPQVGQDATKELLKLLDDAIKTEPKEPKDKFAIEEIYARLSLLWESHDHDTWVNEIANMHEGTRDAWAPIEKVYKVVDEGWWKLLKDPATTNSVEGPPGSSLEPPQAYQTIVFRLNVEAHPGLLKSYLVQKKLTYRWEIEVLPRLYHWRWLGSAISKHINPSIGVLQVDSTQPQVAQYSSRSGLLKAKVKISFEGSQGPVVEQIKRISVERSSDFGVLSKYELADGISSFVAFITSLFSGITMFALTPTFGSLKEYIALFTWGAALDQGKNFVQALAAPSSSTPAVSTVAPPTAAAAPPAAPIAKPTDGTVSTEPSATPTVAAPEEPTGTPTDGTAPAEPTATPSGDPASGAGLEPAKAQPNK